MKTSLQMRLLLPATSALLLAGCRTKPSTQYGTSYGDSINGTGVFYRFLETRGHQMRRTHSLNPALIDGADVIVLFQRDPRGVSPELNRWLQNWVSQGDGHGLLFIGRDFDASVPYWDDAVRRLSGPEQVGAHRLAQTCYRTALANLQALGDAPLEKGFTRYALGEGAELAPSVIDPKLEAATPLALHVATGSRLYVRHHPVAQPDDAILLRSADTPVVIEKKIGEGRALLVANGSFLLNYPLINHEHRVLAANLAEQFAPNRRVWFIEDARLSLAGGGMGEMKFRNPLVFLFVSPINWVVIHGLIVGLIFMLHRSPIVGRPQCPVDNRVHRFSSHLKAYGALLQRTKDVAYADSLIASYRAARNKKG